MRENRGKNVYVILFQTKTFVVGRNLTPSYECESTWYLIRIKYYLRPSLILFAYAQVKLAEAKGFDSNFFAVL